MDQNKNHGVLIRSPRPSDYKFGSATAIDIARHVTDWFPLLPDTEKQYSSKVDFLICSTMSAAHIVAANLNYLLTTYQLSNEAINWFNDNGYFVNGKFSISARFNAKMNGTDKENGQYLNVVGDGFRFHGFLPAADWPITENMTWEEFYKTIPQELKDKAKKALWFLNPQYQWIGQKDIPLSFLSAPVQVATQVCPGWDSGFVVPKCSGRPIQHATVVYGMGVDGVYYNFDQYPPYFQKLASDYELPYNMHYIVSLKAINLRRGMRGSNVLKLQEDLQKLGVVIMADGKFGPKTEQIVINFQIHNGLSADGIAGTLTLAKIKSLVDAKSSRIDAWCEAIKKMEGAKPERNNPGNLRFVGQQYAVNDNGFCKFDTYEHGYNALKTLLINACSGKSSKYNPDGNLYDFYAVYAPDFDGNNSRYYAEFVADELHCSVDIKIKNLL